MDDKKEYFMMRKALLILIIGIFFLGCKEKKKDIENSPSIVKQEEIHKELYGTWIGELVYENSDVSDYPDDYVPDKINLVIKQITKDTVTAQSIVAGVTRPVYGKITENGGGISFVLDEPGTKESDGRYEIKLNGDTLKGFWTSFKGEGTVPKQKFSLVKKTFVYNAHLMLPPRDKYVDWYSKPQNIANVDTVEGGKVDTIGVNPFFRSASDQILKINASSKVLSEKDMKNLRKLDLQIIKNTIYARHGYIFKKETYRDLFNPVDWYTPIYDDVEKEITPIEKNNIALINRFIKYAEDNYDSFGR